MCFGLPLYAACFVLLYVFIVICYFFDIITLGCYMVGWVDGVWGLGVSSGFLGWGLSGFLGCGICVILRFRGCLVPDRG